MKEIDKYFLKYRHICRKIDKKEEELYFEREKTISANDFKEKIGNISFINKGLEIKMIELEKIEERLKTLYNKKKKLEVSHIKDFEKLSKPEYEDIMTGYYLYRKTIKELAIKLDKSIGYVKKLKSDAIKELLEIIKKA